MWKDHVVEMSTNRPAPCQECRGTGKCRTCDGERMSTCPTCKHGQILCTDCDGTGECQYCYGTGQDDF